MKDKIVWIGNRESEILYSSLFYKSITQYGSNNGNNISLNNNHQRKITEFFIEKINAILTETDIKLFFYSYKTAEHIIKKAPYLKQYIVNKYNANFLRFLENKTYSHLWASNILPSIEFTEMFGKECNYNNLHHKFANKNKYIIQENYSSGGTGTFLLTKENEDDVIQQLDQYKCYLVSPYYENSYSVNVHIIISTNNVTILQPSIQIIENINNCLLYKGADFISYKSVPQYIQKQILEYATTLGNLLCKNGYIGVCGLDLLVADKNIFFLEINPRFQASSILINCALKNKGLPDLQTIVYNIYNGKSDYKLLNSIKNLSIDFSMLSFFQNQIPSFNTNLIQLFKNSHKHIDKVIIENENTNLPGDYMFRVIFTTNISSINYDKNLFIYQNLLNYSSYTTDFYKKNLFVLKCALMTQGVRIQFDTDDRYINGKKIKEATFEAIDITINNNNVINCPTDIKFVELSPFSIQKKDNGTALFYFDSFITFVSIAQQEELPIKNTKHNINIHKIGFLTTDRVRIKHTSNCLFKSQKQGCKFCHITGNFNTNIPLEDIYETIDYYQEYVNFRHYLIGGPSNNYDNEIYYIKNIARYIRSISNKSIYVMSIPPNNAEVLNDYYEAGVSEVAFNIEIFDRNIAKTIMPGKGEIPIKQYEKALSLSSKIFGVENTRSMLLIGLDSKKSFLNGIEYLCKLGVTPMISPFRPMDKTALADFVPPTISYILNIYKETKKNCDKYKMELGPACVYCQNNTLNGTNY